MSLRRPVLAAAGLTVAAWAFVAFTPVFSGWLMGDARYYENWGAWTASHLVPYRDFRMEYPPGALPPIVAPVYLRKLFGDHGTYFFWLRVEQLGLALLMLVPMAYALRRLDVSGRRAYAVLAIAGVTPALLGPVALFHYDYWPALLAVAAVAALLARRGVLACALAAAGAVAKVYPAVLVPFALFELWRYGRWRAVAAGVAATLAVVAVTVGPFVLVAPHGIAWALHREASRPLEVESLGASVFAAAHELAGVHLHVVRRAASHNLAGSGPDAAATILRVLTVAALVGIYSLYLRGRRTQADLVAGCAAAVAAYIAFGRVFSPQYLVWLVPLVPLVAGRRGLRASALLLAVLGLTQVFEPYRYIEYWSSFTPWVTWSVVIRNALVLALLGALVWPEPRAAEARDEVAGGYTTAPLRP